MLGDSKHDAERFDCRVAESAYRGALVTDTGGILSHAAIIAREYHIPAVVASGNATSVLRDGQIVIVDGTAGTATIEPTAESSS